MTKRLESFWALRKTDKIDGQGFCESVTLSVAKKLYLVRVRFFVSLRTTKKIGITSYDRRNNINRLLT